MSYSKLSSLALIYPRVHVSCPCEYFEMHKLTMTDNEIYMPPSKASVTIDHVLGSLERHVEERIESHDLQRDSEVHRGIRDLLASFRHRQESLTTPRESVSLDSPESHYQRTFELSGSNVHYGADSAAVSVQQYSTELAVSHQLALDSAAPLTASEDLVWRSNLNEVAQIEQVGHRVDCGEFHTSSANMFSDMVLDLESFPQDELFSADMMFNDYDMHLPDHLEDGNHDFDFNEQLETPPLSDMLASENDATPESFIEEGWKNKHQGNKILRQP